VDVDVGAEGTDIVDLAPITLTRSAPPTAP
jgi:hypothetical protein